jgi:hypothetical protein
MYERRRKMKTSCPKFRQEAEAGKAQVSFEAQLNITFQEKLERRPRIKYVTK